MKKRDDVAFAHVGKIEHLADGDVYVCASDEDKVYWRAHALDLVYTNPQGVVMVPAWLELIWRTCSIGIDHDVYVDYVYELVRTGKVTAQAFEAAYRLGGVKAAFELAQQYRR